MLDHQQIVDLIRAFVAGADQTRSNALADLASQYAAACREANDRLRRCGDYLRRGLRSEAIYAADCQPNLLDVVATLDMPEFDEWEQHCATYDLTPPVRMMIEVAQELNESYAEEEQLRDLLVKHRTLALARAPVWERLAVVRELVAADPLTPFWGDDQAALERAWVPALRLRAAAAIKANDHDAILRLTADADPGVWRATVPPDLLTALTRAGEASRAAAGLAEMYQMVPAVREGLRTGSYADLRRLVTRWDWIVGSENPAVPDDLSDEIAAARQWVSEYEAHVDALAEQEEAAAALRQVLVTTAPAVVLKRYYAAVTAVGLGVPDDLEHDYRRVMKKLDAARAREKLLIVIGIAIGVLLVAGVIGAVIYHQARP